MALKVCLKSIGISLTHQEQSASVGEFKVPDAVAESARKSAFDVAEEFTRKTRGTAAH
jgi:hypothetical protein